MVTTRALIAASMPSVGVCHTSALADGAVAGVILLAVIRSCELRVNVKVPVDKFAAPPRFFAHSGWVFEWNVALDRWELIVVPNQYNDETCERKLLCFWEGMREEDVHVVKRFRIEDIFFVEKKKCSRLSSEACVMCSIFLSSKFGVCARVVVNVMRERKSREMRSEAAERCVFEFCVRNFGTC